MPRPALTRRILLTAVPILLVTALSLRYVGENELGVRDSAIPGFEPAVLESGWHLAPRGLFRVHRYAAGASVVPFGHPDPLKFKSPEGAAMVASGELEVRLSPGSALALHESARGDLEGWLNGQLGGLVHALLVSPDFVPLTRDRIPEMEDEGARWLGEALAPAGLQVSAVRLRTIGYEGGPVLSAGPAPGARRKVLWLAVDSFDWDIIEPLIEKGRMPNLAALRAKGAWGQLLTKPPLLSPVLWTTIATGKSPEKHGIVDFIATDPSKGTVLPETSTLRKSSAFWNILSDSGVTVGVVAWWASFPAERVDGFIATDRIAYHLFKDMIEDQPDDNPLKVYPSRFWPLVASRIKPPARIGDDELSRFIDMKRFAPSFTADDVSRVNDFRTVLAAASTYLEAGRDLFREHPTDVRVLYFEGPDTTSHLFMPFAPPDPEGVDPRLVEAFGSVVDEFYVYQDELIGQLVGEFADEETTIIICSDHGFRTGKARPSTDSRIGHGKAADWHARNGVILLAGKDIRPGERLLGASIYDHVPTLLALYGLAVGEDMDGRALTEAFTEEFLSGHPVRTIASWDIRVRRGQPQYTEPTEDDQDLLAKLASLGYIEQDSPSALTNMALIQLQAGESDKAIESIKAVIEQRDTEAARVDLARAYRLGGKPDLARQELERLVERGWRKPAVLTELAILSRESQDWGEAERLLSEAAAAEPDEPVIQMQFARLYEQQGRWEEALKHYRRVAELDPTSSQALNQSGLILRRLGRTEEAKREFTRAIQANPDDHFAYNSLGLLYHRLGETGKALQMLETGITMAPRNPILQNSLGTVCMDAGEADRAIAAFEKAIELQPDYEEAISNLAMLHKGRGDSAKANEYADRLIELKPEKSDVRVSLALLLSSLNRSDEAGRLLASVLEQEPDNFKALVSLGRMHLRRGDNRQAVTLLERAGRVQGAVPQLWNDLAQAYAGLGRKDEAREALRRSMKLNPDQPEIARRLTEIGG